MLHFNSLSALAGAGKTHELVYHADKLAKRGRRVLFVQPTKLLIEKTVADELSLLNPNYPVHKFHGDVCDGVISKIVQYFRHPSPGGQIVFITHAAFMMTPHFHRKHDWIVLFDEVPGVIDHFDLMLPETHSIITSHLTAQNAGASYVQLVEKAGSQLRGIVENKENDEVLKIFGKVAAQIVSPHWDVYVSQKMHAGLMHGAGAGKRFTTHSILKPTLFDGFKSITFAAACFEETLFYKLCSSQGVIFTPNTRLAEKLRYQRHQNGPLITIHYAFEEDWSKQLRNKVIDTESGKKSILDCVKDAVVTLFGQDPFLWMANKDVSDHFFAAYPKAEKLPNSPHGLNEFQGFHKVAVLSALNPTPAQFTFLDEKGVNDDEVRTAISRLAVYQAVIRSSARKPDPDDKTRKDFVVMDRATADWLAALFPGAKVQVLPGLPTQALKGKPGRKKQHKSGSAKTAACRARAEEELKGQLAEINEGSFAELNYPSLAEDEANSCNENTYREGQIVTPISNGDVFASIYDPVACISVGDGDADEFIALLLDLHTRVFAAKEDSGLISGSRFDPDASSETKRGLANVKYVSGIWFDNDGGDLSYEEFAHLFPYLRMAIWNTYSHTTQKPRWRAFIPTSMAMSMDVHRMIMKKFEKVLKKEGYRTKKELDKNPRIKSRLCHGFDESKFNAASLFYLPCQAKNPADSFFHEFNELSRGPLDVGLWLDDCSPVFVLNQSPSRKPWPRQPLRSRSILWPS